VTNEIMRFVLSHMPLWIGMGAGTIAIILVTFVGTRLLERGLLPTVYADSLMGVSDEDLRQDIQRWEGDIRLLKYRLRPRRASDFLFDVRDEERAVLHEKRVYLGALRREWKRRRNLK